MGEGSGQIWKNKHLFSGAVPSSNCSLNLYKLLDFVNGKASIYAEIRQACLKSCYPDDS